MGTTLRFSMALWMRIGGTGRSRVTGPRGKSALFVVIYVGCPGGATGLVSTIQLGCSTAGWLETARATKDKTFRFSIRGVD